MSPANADDRQGPAVSVVIPTHDRETRLAFALEALAEQTLERSRFEVIVVRSPGTPEPFALAPEGLDVRFVRAERASRPGQRNVGWRAARGELIAFTDDDCRPAPEWLERLLAAAGSRTIVEGATEPDPDEVHLLFGLARSVEVREPSPWYPTCNLALSRELLEQLGGFDEDYVDSGEDTDLALRALAAGAEERFAADAVVRHAVLPQPVWHAARSGWGRWSTTPLLFKRHPEHRRHLFMGVFFNDVHGALALAALGTLALRRRPALAAAAALPYVLLSIDRDNVGPRGLARQGLHLPAKAIADAAIAAGLLRGALRYRTPVL